MSDGRANNGGARAGAGRKSKAEEQRLADLLDVCWPLGKRRKSLRALAAKAEEGDFEALKLLLAYAYGKPVERKEISGPDGEPIKVYAGFDPDNV